MVDFERHLRRDNLRRALLQCGLAGIVVVILLLVLDAVTQTVLIAAIGSSAFVAFVMPRSMQSSPRHLVGGYVVGVASGCVMSLLNSAIGVSGGAIGHAVMIIFGALAISLAMLLMVVTRTEHSPAAALALGLVINEWSLLTIVVILGGIVGLSLMKRLVLPMLLDLV